LTNPAYEKMKSTHFEKQRKGWYGEGKVDKRFKGGHSIACNEGVTRASELGHPYKKRETLRKFSYKEGKIRQHEGNTKSSIRGTLIAVIHFERQRQGCVKPREKMFARRKRHKPWRRC